MRNIEVSASGAGGSGTARFFSDRRYAQDFARSTRDVRTFHRGDRIVLAEGYNGHQFSLENQESAIEFLDHFNCMPIRHGLPDAKKLEIKCCNARVRARRCWSLMTHFAYGHDWKVFDDHRNEHVRAIGRNYFNDGYVGVHKWQVDEYAPACNLQKA
jgi:hypothetical protein